MSGQPDPAIERILDDDRLGEDAAGLVGRLIGDAALGDLVAAMLDHEVPPVFLWRLDYPTLKAVAERTANDVRGRLKALNGDNEPVLAAERRVATADRDPARALLEAATAPGYFALPVSLLGPPAPSSRVFATLPRLMRLLDNRGLLEISELEARPDVLFTWTSGPFRITNF